MSAAPPNSSGTILVGAGVRTIVVDGALLGGTASDSGSIFAGLDEVSVIGSITVTGGLIGGSGDGTGEVFSGGGVTKASLADLIGGNGQSSGSLVSDGALGAITVTGAGPGAAIGATTVHGLIGNVGANSGQISAGTTIGSINVTGSLIGASGPGSGSIFSHSTFNPGGDIQGNVGSIAVSGNVVGGAGVNTGLISAAGNLKTVTVKGNVTGSTASGTGGIVAGAELASTTGGDITTLTIGGALTGGSLNPGAVTMNGSGYIMAGHIGAATIGSIQAGAIGTQNTVTADGAILAANDIGSLTVTGDIVGTPAAPAYNANPVVISAVGQLTPGKTGDLAFGKISVGGNVEFTNFLAGYDQNGNPVTADASIGTVKVAKDWTGSNLVAGVIAGSSGHFGDPADTLISTSNKVIPSIASIIIQGKVDSVPNGPTGDIYGIVAGKIGTLNVNGQALTLVAGAAKTLDTPTDTIAEEVISLSPASA